MTLKRQPGRESRPHADAEVFGSNVNAESIRCKAGSQISVLQAGRVWAIHIMHAPVYSMR